jgi:hypothetical protein
VFQYDKNAKEQSKTTKKDNKKGTRTSLTTISGPFLVHTIKNALSVLLRCTSSDQNALSQSASENYENYKNDYSTSNIRPGELRK